MTSFAAVLRRARGGAREYGIVVIFAVLFVALSFATATFMTRQNMVNLLDQTAIVGILTCAATLCIVSGVFDLSMTAVLAVSAIVTVQVTNQYGMAAGFAAGILTGAALGCVNGLVVNYMQVNSFIATLATSIVYRGLAVVITGGAIVSTTDMSFLVFNRPSPVLGITWGSWLFIGVAVFSGLLLSHTTYGRALYAIGGNREAARLSGIRTKLVSTAVMTLSGSLAATAGLVAASRAASAQASMYTGLELSAIAATVVGGTSIMGGEGTMGKAVVGVLILALIGNGFNLLGIDPTYQLVVQGLLILLAVGADQLLRRRR
jgi:ribose transport system permease protein